MNIVQLCVLAALLAVTQMAHALPAVAPVEVAPSGEQNGLRISIEPSYLDDDNLPIIDLQTGDPHINVVLQNTSAKPLQIFQEWNLWGWDALTLEISAVDSTKLEAPLTLSRGSMPGFTNILSFDVIAPGGTIVRRVRLLNVPRTATDASTEYLFAPLYSGFPLPPPDAPRQVTMSACFSNRINASGDFSIKNQTKTWTGSIASPPQTYLFRWNYQAASFPSISAALRRRAPANFGIFHQP